jgi:hypothetical protein
MWNSPSTSMTAPAKTASAATESMSTPRLRAAASGTDGVPALAGQVLPGVA